MSDIEVALTDLGKIATRELTNELNPIGLKKSKQVSKIGGESAKVTRDNIEKNLGRSIITNKNNLNYKYIDDKYIETK